MDKKTDVTLTFSQRKGNKTYEITKSGTIAETLWYAAKNYSHMRNLSKIELSIAPGDCALKGVDIDRLVELHAKKAPIPYGEDTLLCPNCGKEVGHAYILGNRSKVWGISEFCSRCSQHIDKGGYNTKPNEQQ